MRKLALGVVLLGIICVSGCGAVQTKTAALNSTTQQASKQVSGLPKGIKVGIVETHEGIYIHTNKPLSSFHLPSSAISYYHGSLE